MREAKSFSDVPSLDAPPPHADLSWPEWSSLPLSARISEWLVEILLLAGELRSELESEEGTPLRWIAPEIDGVLTRTDEALQSLAS